MRPIAIGLFESDGRLLLLSATDSVKGEQFLRPPGGAIEKGETAADALRREIREELLSEVEEPRLLEVIESVFVHEGKPGHEVVYVFRARLADERLYGSPEVPVHEEGWEGPARWLPYRASPHPIYPVGVVELLTRTREEAATGPRSATPAPPSIRHADLGAPEVRALVAALDAELMARYAEDGTACHFRLDAAEVAPGAGAFVVAEVDGEPLGCGALRRLDGTSGELKRMYVDPRARGRGVGRALLEALEREARALGLAELLLETGPRQPEALALYERAGYRLGGPFGAYLDSPLSLFLAKGL